MSSAQPEIHETVDGGGRATGRDARQAYDQAWGRFAQQLTPEQFCGSWLLIQCHHIGGVFSGVVVLGKPDAPSLAPVAFYPASLADRSSLAAITELAVKQGRGLVEPRQDAADAQGEPRYQIAYPVRLDGEIRGVVGVEIEWRPEAQLQSVVRDLQWGAAWLELLLRRQSDPVQSERLRSTLALDLVATLLEHPGLRQSATAFTTELAARLGCDRVSLGLLEGQSIRLCAVSHSPNFERRANVVRAIESAMEEAVDQGETVVYPPGEQPLPLVARAHEELLRESGAGSAATFPLAHGDHLIGALTLERAPGYRFDAALLEICEASVSVAGPIVELKRQNETNLPEHAGRSARAFWERLVGAGHADLKLLVLAIAVVAVFLGFAVGDYRVAANARIEGGVQRAITAPTSGYVKEATLRAGDTVTAGQVIGRLNDRDLQVERVKLLSQFDQFIRQQREAMAKGERAQFQIVSAQVSQSEAHLRLIDEQLARTLIVAPLDGIIVSGDLSQRLGSPVERGQVLFEVAPLDSYRVVLQVDEREIGQIAAGQRGQLTLTTMPGERFEFTVTRIMPVNTAKEGRNFFRVEASLGNHPGSRLRPGMEGVGKVYIERRKLVWIWSHSLIDWVRLWIWNWVP
jgi:RND family efflux transporter MFP subunit